MVLHHWLGKSFQWMRFLLLREKGNLIVVELLDRAFLELRLWAICSANAVAVPVTPLDFPLAHSPYFWSTPNSTYLFENLRMLLHYGIGWCSAGSGSYLGSAWNRICSQRNIATIMLLMVVRCLPYSSSRSFLTSSVTAQSRYWSPVVVSALSLEF